MDAKLVRLLDRPRSPTEKAEQLVYVDGRGNCFLQNDNNKVMEHHRGEERFSDEIVDLWRRTHQRRSAQLREAGIGYAFLIGPDKQSLF